MTPSPETKDPRFSEVVELDDGTRVSARAAFLLDQMEAADAELRKMDRTDRRWRRAGLIALALLIMGGIYLFARTSAIADVTAQNGGRISQLEGTIDQLKTDGNALEKQVRALGAQPVVTVPAPVPGTPGATGAQGIPGATPSDAALLSLIRRVIAENPPKDGKTPSAEELLAIIKPLIPAAVPGPQGQPGETPNDQKLLDLIKPLIPDPVPGPEGKAGATGATGETGATGPQGPPGPTCPDGFAPVEHQDTDVLGHPTGPAYLRCERT